MQIKFFLEHKINEKRVTFNATMLLGTTNYLILAIFQDGRRKINRFCKFHCKSLSIKIVLTLFKVADMLHVKDPIRKFLKFFVLYKFVCPFVNKD